MAINGKTVARRFFAADRLARDVNEVAQTRTEQRGYGAKDRVALHDLDWWAGNRPANPPMCEAAEYFSKNPTFFRELDEGYAKHAGQPTWADGTIGRADGEWWLSAQGPEDIEVGGRQFRTTKFLGAGWLATTFEIEPTDGMSILKIYRSDRAWAVDDVVHSSKKMSSDAGFRARFGDIIPRMIGLGAEGILMERMKGVPFTDLNDACRANAERQIPELIAYAQKLFGGRAIDANTGNVFFDPADGHITGWADFFPGE